MEKDIFKERGRGEEEAYFRQQDAKLIERLHQEAKLEAVSYTHLTLPTNREV